MRFIPLHSQVNSKDVLAISTEDGRIVFYDIKNIPPTDADQGTEEAPIAMAHPGCPAVAELGGSETGTTGRIKDFEVLRVPGKSPNDDSSLLCITGLSDGTVQIWSLDLHTLDLPNTPKTPATEFNKSVIKPIVSGISKEPQQVGTLIGTRETGNRITCLSAFVMDEEADGNGNSADDDFQGLSDHNGNEVSSSSDEE